MSEQRRSVQHNGAWGAAAFGATLALIIGLRLDQAALAAMVGVICGIAASIPTSLLIVSLLRNREARGEGRGARGEGQLWSPERGRRGMAQNRWGEVGQAPPVVVITAPNAQLQQPTTWPGAYAAPLPAQRQFSIIGEEEMLCE